ncbi:MAG: hypothetical protein M1832_005004 [Thelocarpon impressellum]|nr:MAG: hypothetical protein M1832_005004 [Thelocarpon impressellum]
MPGRDLEAPAHAAADILPNSTLTAHKPLPRRPRERSSQSGPLDPDSFDQPKRRKLPSPPVNAQSRPTSGPAPDAGGNPRLPPTPPSQNSQGDVRPRPAHGTQPGMSFADGGSGPNTPVNLRGPPTPDVTPPRNVSKHSASRSVTSLWHQSPRTASFKTAREDQWSSDDDAPPRRPGFGDELEETPGTTTPKAKPREPGLDPGASGINDRRRQRNTVGAEFAAFDGSWSNGTKDAGLSRRRQREPEGGLPTNVVRDKGRDRRRQDAPRSAPERKSREITSPSREPRREEAIEATARRERAGRSTGTAATDRTSTDQFAGQVSWPTMLDELLLDLSPGHADVRRFSGTSGTSTIVEAFVVDRHTSQKRRVLRHKGKNEGLRALGRSPARAASISLPAAHAQNQLVHQDSHVPERSRGRSSVGGGQAGAEAEAGRHGEGREKIRVIVIPERSSSIRSTRNSVQSRGSHSLTSASQYSRSGVADKDAPGYFDLPRRRNRAASDSAQSIMRLERGREVDYSPVIPPRSSSLSAATSRNVSRTTSLTSASAHSRTSVRRAEAVQVSAPRAVSYRQEKGQGARAAEPGRASKYLSAPLTPFSNGSNDSSTPEALEVSEAKAVSIFPHRNNSLVVVQQSSRPTSQEIEQSALAMVQRHGTATPAAAQQSEPARLADSPLRQPREPPRPPAFKIIPPTPFAVTPSEEVERRLGDAAEDGVGDGVGDGGKGRSSAALSMVKRALVNRRYSEAFVSPFSRWRMVETSRPATVERKEARLSPFWRPRGFWDDIEVPEEHVHDEFLERGRSELLEAPRIGRRVSYHALDVDGRDERAEARRRIWGVPSSGDRTSPSRARKRRRIQAIPGLSVQIEYVGFKGVTQRLREAQASRAARTRERERLKMKGRISPPRAIAPHLV